MQRPHSIGSLDHADPLQCWIAAELPCHAALQVQCSDATLPRLLKSSLAAQAACLCCIDADLEAGVLLQQAAQQLEQRALATPRRPHQQCQPSLRGAHSSTISDVCRGDGGEASAALGVPAKNPQIWCEACSRGTATHLGGQSWVSDI